MYDVVDVQSGEHVALKWLTRDDPRALLRFKNEFRSLAQLRHPNLVRLHELFNEDETWWVTMELIRGRPVFDAERASQHQPTAATMSEMFTWTAPTQPERGARDHGTTRRQLAQLAEGVAALHTAGMLHRDLKPSNVLVDESGRVVVLDFGLVTESDALNVEVVGTPAYLAPEVLEGEPATEAADWYAVGVMLYEGLTGRLPFIGRPEDVMRDKRTFDPAPPAELRPGIPDDLAETCMQLLRRSPQERMSGAALRASLERSVGGHPLVAVSHATARRFVGRTDALDRLAAAFDASEKASRLVLVEGEPGIGKSALSREFLSRLRTRAPHALVLAGRCHAEESLPFKAFDPIIDQLSEHLRDFDQRRLEAVLPREVRALASIFPVLAQVPAIQRAPEVRVADATEMQRRGIAALRQLLADIASERPIVVCIDDTQWGDADSARVLRECLLEPGAPAVFWLCCQRPEPSITDGLEPHEHIVLSELTPEEGRRLIAALDDDVAEELQATAGAAGSPLLILELCRAGGGATLAESFSKRVTTLPETSRTALELISLAARPLPLRVVERAIEGADAPDAIDQLVQARLVITAFGRGGTVVMPFHDRLREWCVQGLDDERRRALFARIAAAENEEPQPDHEALTDYWFGAGNRERAAQHAIIAGRLASAQLAFTNAARLFDRALSLHEALGRDPERDLLLLSAEAHRNADDVELAGRRFLQAADTVDTTDRAAWREAQRMRIQAAASVMLSGDYGQAERLAREVVEECGGTIASSERRALPRALASLAWLRMRGTSFVERREHEVDPDALLQLDVECEAAMGILLAMYQPFLAVDLAARGLPRALDLGEPRRICKFLALHLVFRPGVLESISSDPLIGEATALAEHVDDPYLRGVVLMFASWSKVNRAEWQAVLRYGSQAEAIFREQCTGVPMEIHLCTAPSQLALRWTGQLREMARRYTHMREALRRRNNELATRLHFVESAAPALLAADRPGDAHDAAREALTFGPPEDQTLINYRAATMRAEAMLYAEPARGRAHQVLREDAHYTIHSPQTKADSSELETHHLRGRAALAAARGVRGIAARIERARYLLLASGMATKVERKGLSTSLGLAALLRGGVAFQRGRHHEALAALRSAILSCDEAGIVLYATAARWQYGRLLGGDRGAELMTDAEELMRDEGIVAPDRYAEMLAPGYRS